MKCNWCPADLAEIQETHEKYAQMEFFIFQKTNKKIASLPCAPNAAFSRQRLTHRFHAQWTSAHINQPMRASFIPTLHSLTRCLKYWVGEVERMNWKNSIIENKIKYQVVAPNLVCPSCISIIVSSSQVYHKRTITKQKKQIFL